MAIVPNYKKSEKLDPNYQRNIEVSATSEHMGAAIGRGMQNLGKGVGQAASAVSQVLELEGEAEGISKSAEYNEYLQESAYGENGFMRLRGEAAIKARTTFDKQKLEVYRQMAATLPWRAKRHFYRGTRRAFDQMSKDVILHNGQATKEAYMAAAHKKIETAAEGIRANAGNPEAQDNHRKDGEDMYFRIGEANGWSSEKIRQEQKAFAEMAFKDSLARTAEQDPEQAMMDFNVARQQMENNKSPMDPALQEEIEKTLQPQIDDQKSKRIASEFLQANEEEERPSPRPNFGNHEMELYRSHGPRKSEFKYDIDPESLVEPNEDGQYASNDLAKFASGTTGQGALPVLEHTFRAIGGPNMSKDAAKKGFALVYGVIGSSAKDGKDRLPAATFLAMGDVVHKPQKGDVVILSGQEIKNENGEVIEKGEKIAGFFHDMNGDGNMRIVVGNKLKPGMVSIISVPLERAEGIRRVRRHSEDNSDNLTNSYEGLYKLNQKLTNIEPQLRDLVRTHIAKQSGQKQKAAQQQANDFMRQGIDHVMKNPDATVDTLPKDLQKSLGPEALQKLDTFQQQLGKNKQPQTDRAYYLKLKQMAQTDPDYFAQQDLYVTARMHLNNADYDRITKMQEEARAFGIDAANERDSYLGLDKRVETKAAQYFNNPHYQTDWWRFNQSKASANRKSLITRSQDEIHRLFEKRQQEAPGKPVQITDEDIHKILASQTLAVHSHIDDPVLGRMTQSLPNHLAQNQRAEGTVSRFVIASDEIPTDVRAELTTMFRGHHSRDPSDKELVNAYRNFKASQGGHTLSKESELSGDELNTPPGIGFNRLNAL